jgi:hypothetical protein
MCPNVATIAPVPRRRKPASQRKEHLIRIRVTATQRKLFEKAAGRHGLELSAWARMILLREARSKDS